MDLQPKTQGKSEGNQALLILIIVPKQLQLCSGSWRGVPSGQSSSFGDPPCNASPGMVGQGKEMRGQAWPEGTTAPAWVRR